MDLKNLMSTWKEYQKWLKDQGINSSNIQEKLPEFIDNLKQDPEKLQQLKGMLGDGAVATNYPNAPQRTGNLTPQQLEMLRKFKH